MTIGKKLNTYILASAFIVILFHHWVMAVPQVWQWLFLGLTILFSGVPHGALDHLVAKKTSDLRSERFHQYSFYIKYISRMLLFGIFWYISPSLSLVIFLLISAFHFGETDIPISANTHRHSAVTLQIVYGFMLLLILLFAHTGEVLPLISQLSGSNVTGLFQSLGSGKNQWIMTAVGTILFSLATGWYVVKNKPSLSWCRDMLVQTVAIIGIITLLPLPLAFAFYFGCWHSLNALQSIRNHLSLSMERKISWPWMIQQLLPYTAVAFAGILALIALITISGSASLPTAGFLIGIAVLTAPHFEVMSEMYSILRK